MNKAKNIRFEVLDGLRGLAMILVFINHIDTQYIVSFLPQNLQFLVQWLFVSGKNGIALFFLLSGFLMGYLYFPIANNGQFIFSRYARIFPLYITMATAMWIFHIEPNLHLVYKIPIILAIALLTRLIWIYLVEKFKLSKTLSKLFFFLQLITAGWYGIIIMRNPPIWFDGLPFAVKEISIYLANITLTLPFGDYLPMLDGVYWSLVPEILFYLLFPILIAPTISSILKQNKFVKFSFLVLLIPFIFGLSTLFREIRAFQMMFIEYFIYFFGGITVALFAKKELPKIPNKLKIFFNPASFIFLLFLASQVPQWANVHVHVLIRIAWVIPFSLLLYYLLDDSSSLHKLLIKKPMTFLGAISFSLYLVHTSIVDGAKLLYTPNSTLSNVLFVSFTFATACGISYLLHILVEELYFKFKESKKEVQDTSKVSLVKISYTLTLVIFLLVFIGFSSKFNFFSRQYQFRNSNVNFSNNTLISENHIVLNDKPIFIMFTSPDEMLGIVELHITHQAVQSNNKTSVLDQRLLLKIREDSSNNWYAQQEVSTAEIGDSASYLFGFPTILESKGKNYTLSLQIINKNDNTQVTLHTDNKVMSTVHQVNKKKIITNLSEMTIHLNTKINNIISNKNAIITIISLSPLLILFLYIINKKNL